MPDCCICLTTDKRYLFPTLVSAIQARANASQRLADVAIFCFEEPSHHLDCFAEACQRSSVQLILVDRGVIEGAHIGYSRFFLDDFVPPAYSQFLYLDGDTQIVSSIDPLIDVGVAPCTFLASADPLAFNFGTVKDAPQSVVDFFTRYSKAPISDYFNSGVLRINREGWNALAKQAYRFCRDLPNGHSVFPGQKFWDQDGLNACLSSARKSMSLKWNFPIFMRNGRVESQIKPAIYHFMAEPKPWHGNFPPWNKSFTLPYIELVKRFPALAPHTPTVTSRFRLKYTLQQRYKLVMETANWAFGDRRRRILSYEQTALI